MRAKRTNLTTEMKDALAYVRQHDGHLYKYPGGYWSRAGFIPGSGERSFGTTTVRALVSRGAAEYTVFTPTKYGGKYASRMTPTEAQP